MRWYLKNYIMIMAILLFCIIYQDLLPQHENSATIVRASSRYSRASSLGKARFDHPSSIYRHGESTKVSALTACFHILYRASPLLIHCRLESLAQVPFPCRNGDEVVFVFHVIVHTQ